MIWLIAGIWLVGGAVLLPLFLDKDDPWGFAFAFLWPLLLLAAIAGLFLGAARYTYVFFFGDTPDFDQEDPRG